MIDSGNVLVLRTAWNGSGFAKEGPRAPRGATAPPRGLVIAAICHVDAPATNAFVSAFRETALSRCEAPGSKFIAALVTEHSTNSFPALPVRGGENVFVCFTLFADLEAGRKATDANIVPRDLQAQISKPIEILRLLPTARSR